jgi:hypothetical protein
MSRNLSVSNFTVGGTLTVTGVVTLSEIFSSSSAEFVNLSITNLPTSSQIPSSDYQLTNKLYLDGEINTVNSRITSVDNSRKTYVDSGDVVLDSRITSVDNSRKIYVDSADATLNSRITTVDNSRKSYVDEQINSILVKIINLPDSTFSNNGDNFFNNSDFDITNIIFYNSTSETSPELSMPNSFSCAGKTCTIYNNSGKSLRVYRSPFYSSSDGNNKFINFQGGISEFSLDNKKTITMISVLENWLVTSFY